MSKLLEIALGIVTSIGGFLEAGSITTSAQAGATFGYELLWTLAVGVLALVALIEMSGRLSAVSQRTYTDLLRERFGARFFVLPLVAVVLVSFLVLASEIGGTCVALQLASGVEARWWAVPVALLCWLLLWKGTFSVVEKGSALLGLVGVAFVVGAVRLGVHWPLAARDLLPSLPAHDGAKYWFLVVNIIGASVSPYLLVFYSAGAVEERWDRSYLRTNQAVAVLGMSFGGVLAAAVLLSAAMVLHPRGISVDSFHQVALTVATPLGHPGFVLFIITLAVACFGAAAEISLAIAYMLAQGFGWRWSEDARPRKNARFALSYTVAIALAGIVMLAGVDPVKLTNVSMALTAMSLPITVIPLAVIMNDRETLGRNVNGWFGNVVLAVVSVLSIVLMLAALPLQLLGGG